MSNKDVKQNDKQGGDGDVVGGVYDANFAFSDDKNFMFVCGSGAKEIAKEMNESGYETVGKDDDCVIISTTCTKKLQDRHPWLLEYAQHQPITDVKLASIKSTLQPTLADKIKNHIDPTDVWLIHIPFEYVKEIVKIDNHLLFKDGSKLMLPVKGYSFQKADDNPFTEYVFMHKKHFGILPSDD